MELYHGEVIGQRVNLIPVYIYTSVVLYTAVFASLTSDLILTPGGKNTKLHSFNKDFPFFDIFSLFLFRSFFAPFNESSESSNTPMYCSNNHYSKSIEWS